MANGMAPDCSFSQRFFMQLHICVSIRPEHIAATETNELNWT